ncbi:hypothetical protein CLOSTASPAR_05198 [[Clostridium] asparagiforme DSM 15981]|uniref:Uncharacterized protein n=1 Tax=[Clostridium] asparagiforme DSM 15981 TaxID=518636 RepID=C0D7F1_9FIRM|nr:hypothetical protein CLOSTASPAR_05198 [[Clostridium] asparagiforme DSM 15981]
MSARKCKQLISFQYFMLLFITLFVRLGTIRVPFYPLQDGFSLSKTTDFIGLSGWKNIL